MLRTPNASQNMLSQCFVHKSWKREENWCKTTYNDHNHLGYHTGPWYLGRNHGHFNALTGRKAYFEWKYIHWFYNIKHWYWILEKQVTGIDRVRLNYHLLKLLQANNTLHMFHPFFTIPIITLAIVKIEQKSIVHLKINNIDQPSLYTCLFIGEQLGYRLYGHRN